MTSLAQDAEILIPGEMVIQFENQQDFQKFKNQAHPDLYFDKMISSYLQLYLFKYNPDIIDGAKLSINLSKNNLVKAVGQNFKAQQRFTTPNDEFFENQRSFDLIEAPEAWDINTSAPEELVVAVIEGADINHEDLKDNIWTNNGEIPDDGIDNDNNGYIDDYWGVNVVDSTDTPVVDDHGTSVAGIIGGRGDNEIGVAGMMWDIKMMIVSSNLTFSKIIESYDYVYRMRKKYNETNGAEGAKVVATNSSFGVNNRFINSNSLFPIWCESYNMMGSVGVLSAAAVNNTLVNIGIVGDIPGLCPSDYLITVTGTNLDDELKAAHNINHVDIAAPEESFTTDLNNSYSKFIGTSAATPIVTGALAMMYSYPCEGLQNQITNAPEQTALILKSILMESVDRIDELTDKVASRGRLNIFNAMQALESHFGSPKGELGFINIYPNPVHETLFVEYQTPETSEYELKIYDAMGRLVYLEFIPEVCAKSIIEVPALSLATGMYFMSIENINNIQTAKFIVH